MTPTCIRDIGVYRLTTRSAHCYMVQDHRIVRVLLPIQLIRRMDEAILAGRGGYDSRQALIRDALEAYLMELMYEPAPAEPLVGSHPKTDRAEDQDGAAGPKGEIARPNRASSEWCGTCALEEKTKISAPSWGPIVDDGIADAVDQPLFGLHNRDYPSIWAARHLADLARSGPIPLDDFHVSAVDAAWRFASELAVFEKVFEKKLTALFPTNRRKPESAAEMFLTFAIGTCEVDGPKLKASGPLYAWRVCQVVRPGGKLLIGLTRAGYELLQALDGMTIWMPHPPDKARVFFEHLRRFAPSDWWGFSRVLTLVEPGITRAELVAGFQRERPDWTATQASTVASGYVARAREWGLIAPKLQEGRYMLTEFGIRLLRNDREESHAGI